MNPRDLLHQDYKIVVEHPPHSPEAFKARAEHRTQGTIATVYGKDRKIVERTAERACDEHYEDQVRQQQQRVRGAQLACYGYQPTRSC